MPTKSAVLKLDGSEVAITVGTIAAAGKHNVLVQFDGKTATAQIEVDELKAFAANLWHTVTPEHLTTAAKSAKGGSKRGK